MQHTLSITPVIQPVEKPKKTCTFYKNYVQTFKFEYVDITQFGLKFKAQRVVWYTTDSIIRGMERKKMCWAWYVFNINCCLITSFYYQNQGKIQQSALAAK